MTPIRIQRKRTKGWRMPENTVSVCRPGKWGNPFQIKVFGDEFWIVADIGIVSDVCVSLESARKRAVSRFGDRVNILPEFRAEIKSELAGKNLACFCPLDQPCHADVLLEIANRN